MLILYVHGATVRQSAKEMGVSPRTVNQYRYQVRLKLDLWEPADLLRWAVENGLADLRRVYGRS